MTNGKRVEFTAGVRQLVARKAMYVCSNPDCLRVTGFSTEKGKPRAIAQAAHILPASQAGPRRTDDVTLPDGSQAKRGDEENAIWLCLPCHYRVDADWEVYSEELLLEWKREHEDRASALVGLDLEQSLLKLAEVRVGHDWARAMLAWLDDHRFMYFDDARECPEYVWKAVDALRVKLVDMRSRVLDMDSDLGRAISGIEAAVQEFIVTLNDVRVDEIQVTSGDPNFERFSNALICMRSRILKAVEVIAKRENYVFRNIPVDW
ncbi:hypothetical protein [Nesterenkonia sphaerica]|uniref:HNH endonuclease n=1 Tax=Nesterenkonia sphaerica TaxID=1804988 RepID=A0A5R8ZYX7_9MICC|nr:hypothetical protein [Nesterenkonia sphaerica]TLP71124.1 hypothetical protein FEF27_12755 [Nesterenkonia sphaerica]